MDRRRKRLAYRQQAQPGISTPHTATYPAVSTGSGVYATDRARIGRATFIDHDRGVIVVRGGFLVFGHTYYIPMRYIRDAAPGRVSLRVTRGEVRRMTAPPTSARGTGATAGNQPYSE